MTDQGTPDTEVSMSVLIVVPQRAGPVAYSTTYPLDREAYPRARAGARL